MKLISFLLISLLLTSCLTYEETITLNDDRSGILEIDIEFGKFISMVSDLDEENNDNQEFSVNDLDLPKGMELLSSKNDHRNGRRYVYFKFSFDNIENLEDMHIRGSNSNFDFEDFFHNIKFDGENYRRVIRTDNNSDEEIPGFVKSFIDIEFIFNIKFESGLNESWSYDLDDIARHKDIIMEISN